MIPPKPVPFRDRPVLDRPPPQDPGPLPSPPVAIAGSFVLALAFSGVLSLLDRLAGG